MRTSCRSHWWIIFVTKMILCWPIFQPRKGFFHVLKLYCNSYYTVLRCTVLRTVVVRCTVIFRSFLARMIDAFLIHCLFECVRKMFARVYQFTHSRPLYLFSSPSPILVPSTYSRPLHPFLSPSPILVPSTYSRPLHPFSSPLTHSHPL